MSRGPDSAPSPLHAGDGARPSGDEWPTPATLASMRALPKGHLHLHLEGSARPSTVAQLAAAAGLPVPAMPAEPGLPAFIAAYGPLFTVVSSPDSLLRICRELVEDEVADGVAVTQPAICPHYYTKPLGLGIAEVIDLMLEGFAAGAHGHNIHVLPLLLADRAAGGQHAIDLLRAADRHLGDGVRAFGVAGVESATPAGDFEPAFAAAHAAGLLVVPHCGETGDPHAVGEMLTAARPHRIAHGVRAVEDPALTQRLVEQSVVCDVAVTSNLALGLYPGVDTHPLPQLVAAGVPVTLNGDDSFFFGSTPSEEYALARDAMGLDDRQLADIATTSVVHSGLPASSIRPITAAIADWLATRHRDTSRAR